ncbi:MAG: histidine kinase, partial [Lysobacter sp.]
MTSRPRPLQAVPDPVASVAGDEPGRLFALETYGLLDSVAEAAYDDIVRLAAALCDTPGAAIALLDRDRVWFKARIGVDASELPRSHSICSQLI